MSKCEHCGTEVEWQTIQGHLYLVEADGIHTDYDCRGALKARVAALEAQLKTARDSLQWIAGGPGRGQCVDPRAEAARALAVCQVDAALGTHSGSGG